MIWHIVAPWSLLIGIVGLVLAIYGVAGSKDRALIAGAVCEVIAIVGLSLSIYNL